MGAQKWLESTQNETPARQVFLWAKNKCVSALSLHQRVSESNMSMMDNCSSMSKQYNTWYSTRYGIENLMFVPYCISIVIEEWKRNVCYLLGECVAETERILKQRWFFSDLLVKKFFFRMLSRWSCDWIDSKPAASLLNGHGNMRNSYDADIPRLTPNCLWLYAQNVLLCFIDVLSMKSLGPPTGLVGFFSIMMSSSVQL